MMQAGDRCPQCKVGLIEHAVGEYVCTQCSFTQTIDEVVAHIEAQRTQVADFKFKPFTLRVRIETPEEGEILLTGAILARQNNSAPHWDGFIEGLNSQLEAWRAARLQAQVLARADGDG